MTYQVHGHPIIINPYKLAKNEDNDMKLSGYDHRGHFRSHKRPTLSWSNLTSLVLTYHDHGHPNMEECSRRKWILVPHTYGWQDNLQISIDMLFNMQNFISYEEFHSMFYRITGGKTPAESSYLKFRHDIMNNFGPVNKGKKYPPPIKNKKLEERVFQSPIELLKKTKKGQ